MSSKFQAKLSYSRKVRKRNDIDIMANILNETHKGARKTRIMYRCNLSHKQLKVYLKLLLELEFLVSHSDLDIFRTTAKGRKFLDAYRTLKAFVS